MSFCVTVAVFDIGTKMKITAPIDKVEEVKYLIEAGADELYCGVYHSAWYNTLTRPNIKPSSKSSLKSFKDFGKIVQKAKGYNVPVYITLNAYYYRKDSYNLIKDDLEKAINLEASGFVVTDISLIKEIKRICKDKPIILSTMGNCFNTETISYYKDLGVSRIVFPRDLSLSELEYLYEELKRKNIELPLEIFVQNLTCRNVNGFCRYHGYLPSQKSQFLMDRIIRGFNKILTAFYPYLFVNYILPLEKKYRDKYCKPLPCMLKYKAVFISRFNNSKETVYPFWIGEPYQSICAACGIFYFKNFGIDYVKIIGRGLPTSKKIKDVRFIRSLTTILNEQSLDFDEFFKKGQENYYQIYGLHCKETECHYPSFVKKRIGAKIDE